MLANNPSYAKVFEVDKYTFYAPANDTQYHMSRLVELQVQNVYASNGITKDLAEAHYDKMLELLNDDKPIKTLRSDLIGFVHSLKYRMKNPIDDKVSIRAGAILTFMTDGEVEEHPDKCELFWLNKKMALAEQYPEAYTFFLTMGVQSLKVYSTLLDTSIDLDYFRKREEAIKAISSMSPS
jgi:hypothetical protein